MLPVYIIIVNIVLSYLLVPLCFPSLAGNGKQFLSISYFGGHLLTFILISVSQSLLVLFSSGALKIPDLTSICFGLLVSYGSVAVFFWEKLKLNLLTEFRNNFLSLLLVASTFIIIHSFSYAIIHTDGLSMLALSHDGPSILWRMAFLDTMWGPVNTLLSYAYNLNYFTILTAWGYSFLAMIFINNILRGPKLFEIVFWGVLFSSKYFVYHLLLTHNSVICGIILFYVIWFYTLKQSTIFYILLFIFGFYRIDTMVYLFFVLNILSILDITQKKANHVLKYWIIFTLINIANYFVIDPQYYDALPKESALGLAIVSFTALIIHAAILKFKWNIGRLLDISFKYRIIYVILLVAMFVIFHKPESFSNTTVNLFSVRSRWPLVWWFISIFSLWKIYLSFKRVSCDKVQEKIIMVLSGRHLFWLLYGFHIFFMTLFRSGYRIGFGDSGKRMFVIVLFGFFAVFFHLSDLGKFKNKELSFIG